MAMRAFLCVTAKDVVAPNFRERIFHPDDLQKLRGKRRAALVRGASTRRSKFNRWK
jgi:hypothetical protein